MLMAAHHVGAGERQPGPGVRPHLQTGDHLAEVAVAASVQLFNALRRNSHLLNLRDLQDPLLNLRDVGLNKGQTKTKIKIKMNSKIKINISMAGIFFIFDGNTSY